MWGAEMGTKLGSGTGVASMVVVRVVVVRVVGMVEVGLGVELEAEEMATGWAVEARANVMEEMVMVGAGMAVVALAVLMVAGGKETAVAPEALFVGAAVRVRAVHLMVLVVSLGARVVTGASEVEARVAEREAEAAVVVKVEEV